MFSCMYEVEFILFGENQIEVLREGNIFCRLQQRVNGVKDLFDLVIVD